MANIFELNIYLHEDGDDNDKDKKKLNKTTNSDAEEEEEEGKEKKSLEDLIKAYRASKVVHWGNAVIDNVIKPMYNMDVKRVGSIYGDVARANQMNNMASVGSKVKGTVMAGVNGFMYGGPWGAVAGIALDLAGNAIEMAQNAMEYTNKQLDHQYNSQMSKERLGMLAINKGR